MILLFAINYFSFKSNWLSESPTQDKAILQSFVVFIAFDRALTLLKGLEFKPSDFLKILVTSVFTQWQKTQKEIEEFRVNQYNSDEGSEKTNQI